MYTFFLPSLLWKEVCVCVCGEGGKEMEIKLSYHYAKLFYNKTNYPIYADVTVQTIKKLQIEVLEDIKFKRTVISIICNAYSTLWYTKCSSQYHNYIPKPYYLRDFSVLIMYWLNI